MEKNILARIDLLKEVYGTDFIIENEFGNRNEIILELILACDITISELNKFDKDLKDYINYMTDLKQHLQNQLNV